MAFVSSPLPLRGSSTSSSVCLSRPFSGVPVRTRVAPPRSTAPRMIFGKTVAETLAITCNFKTFLSLAAVAQVSLDFPAVTVFAPSDAAFARLPAPTLPALLADPAAAAAVVRRHLLVGKVLTSKQIVGAGFWESVPGGPLGYEGVLSSVRIGNARILNESADLECDNGTIHTIDAVLTTPGVEFPTLAGRSVPGLPLAEGSVVSTAYPKPVWGAQRAADACLTSTTGGRKAMGLVQQLPFWMYGPPFNAVKQEEYEPISAANPEAGVDYQVMPPGTVIVEPDEVSAAKLLPVSGMSKYIGKTQRLVEGDGQSNYSRLPY